MVNFGWSLPAGCSSLPTEEQEFPLIAYVCPNCKAIDIDWQSNRIDQSFDNENGLYEKFVCPYCQHQINSWDMSGFDHIYSDDFADKVQENLPDGWEVLKTTATWRTIIVGTTDGTKTVNIKLDLDKNGQVNLNEIQKTLDLNYSSFRTQHSNFIDESLDNPLIIKDFSPFKRDESHE